MDTEAVEALIEQYQDTCQEVKDLVNMIVGCDWVDVDSIHEIEAAAFAIGHNDLVLNPNRKRI